MNFETLQQRAFTSSCKLFIWFYVNWFRFCLSTIPLTHAFKLVLPADIDECASEPCIHGECDDQVNGYVCECIDGYTGVICDSEIS